MLISWEQCQRIQHENASRYELPLAQMQALFCNANRDSKTKPFDPEDFRLFRSLTKDTAPAITAPAANALISLHAEGKLHPLLMNCWKDATEAAQRSSEVPEVRGYVSDDESVWVIAPTWEDGMCRGLVCVTDFVCGEVLVRDVDRPLVTYRLQIPSRRGGAAGWIDASYLLRPAT